VALIAPQALPLQIALLKAGLDESFVRPFAPLKLLNYLHSKVRASDPGMRNEQVLRYGAIELNDYTHRVHVGDREIHLPPIEFKMLRHMLQRPGKVFTRVELIEAVWPGDAAGAERSVDVHIARLRKAIRYVSKQQVVRTVRSAGYALSNQ
jgi:two-component system phosphate regulon response regulator PhoB